jgi:hypothetical protein
MQTTTRPRIPYADRIVEAETAYLSIPTYLKERREEVLRAARLTFPKLRLGSFDTEFDRDEFKGWKEWAKAFGDFIADCDLLIVACDSSRIITRGVRGEIDIARRLDKPILLYKADDKELRRFWGYERTENGGRLLKRSEGLALKQKRTLERLQGGTYAADQAR